MRSFAAKIGWPLFALAAAFGLWITFIGSPELVTSVSIPLQFENVPPDLETTSQLPGRVQVEIRGPSARLRSFSSSSAVAVVNLESVHTAGERSFTIDRDNLELPAGITAVRISPSDVRLRFERRLEVSVPVHVRFAAPPPAGYRVAFQQVVPDSLKIAGPESLVRQVRVVETDPLDLSIVVGKSQFRAHAFLDDPQLRFASSAIVQVSVSLEKIPQGGAATDAQAVVRN